MKDRIAGFLGELAEELGWTPDFEHARVRPETTGPAIRRPTVLTPDDDSATLRATPVERMQTEINQLHSTVKHLGSEVIQLRAQMAKSRSVPVPPDAEEAEAAAVDGARARPAPEDTNPTDPAARYDLQTQKTVRVETRLPLYQRVPEPSRKHARGRDDLSRYHPAQVVYVKLCKSVFMAEVARSQAATRIRSFFCSFQKSMFR